MNRKEHIHKDKHHISWKNHGIEKYIADALEQYLKSKEKKCR